MFVEFIANICYNPLARAPLTVIAHVNHMITVTAHVNHMITVTAHVYHMIIHLGHVDM